MSISISINDQPTELAEPTPLAALLKPPYMEQHTSELQAFAVAVNGEFVPRTQYGTRLIIQGDQLDIVSPVGGG